MFDYNRAIATANRLIAQFGTEAILRNKGQAFGPAHAPTTNPVFTRIVCVRLDLRYGSQRQSDPAAARLAEAKQERMLVRVAEGVVPEIGDQIMVNNVASFSATQPEQTFKRQLTVESVSPLRPAGVDVMYDLVVKS